MFERKPYRVITAHVVPNVGIAKDFTKAVYKETHEGTMVSFDDAPFQPSNFTFTEVLTWFEIGGAEKHGYTWELT